MDRPPAPKPAPVRSLLCADDVGQAVLTTGRRDFNSAYHLRMHADNKTREPLPVEQAELAAEVFRMLAEPTRVRMLWAMLDQELAVNELADLVAKPAPSVSQHLAKLRMARLVRTRREGTKVFYRVENDHVARLVRDAVFNAEHAGPEVPRHHQDEAIPLRSAPRRTAK